jgi:hypothetical protein
MAVLSVVAVAVAVVVVVVVSAVLVIVSCSSGGCNMSQQNVVVVGATAAQLMGVETHQLLKLYAHTYLFKSHITIPILMELQ